MRLIIEPTQTPSTDIERQYPHHRIVIEHPHDDLDINEMADMMRAALLAQGYDPETVNEIIEPR